MCVRVMTVNEFVQVAARYVDQGYSLYTCAEYSRKNGITRQAVNNRINRGQLRCIRGPDRLILIFE